MITIDYFTDMLCIWAYGGQVRVDELKQRFGDEIRLNYRFISIFASACEQIEKNWSDREGYQGFNHHLNHVAAGWDHVQCNSRLWLECRPRSSITSHVVLKAVSLLEQQGNLPANPTDNAGKSCFETLMWNIRKAFFEQGINISEFSALQPLVEQQGIDWQAVKQLIENGEAFASLNQDEQLRHQYCLQGSPSYVLNEGRQVLYGNVGYRIIEANVLELLHGGEHPGDASWC